MADPINLPAAPQSDPLPLAPGPNDPGEVFDEKGYEFTIKLEPFRQQVQAQADYIAQGVQIVVDAVDQAVADATSQAGTHAAAAKSSQNSASYLAGRAQASERQAGQYSAEAAAARDAAILSGKMYPSTAAGLAGTSSGEYFSVAGPGVNEYATLYLNDSNAAVSQGSYPTAAYVEQRTSPATESKQGTVKQASRYEAISGTPGKYPDAAGVKAAIESRPNPFLMSLIFS